MRAPDDGAGMSAKAATLEDAVPRDAPGTREIGFSTPERYNASAILYDNLAANGWRPAVIGPAGTRTYAELAADVAAFGAGLLSLGLQRGDRVLLFLDDTPAYPAALFGAIRAGLVPLLINTLTPSDLLQFYLSDSGATVAVADAAFADRVGVSTTPVLAWIRQGQLPVVRLGRLTLLPEDALRRLLDRQANLR